jgi:YbbR domain-containing protein
VRVTVEENTFESLGPGDFQATVDLEGLTVGEYERPVDVEATSARGGLRVDEVLPEEIAVVLVAREAKEVPVVINVTGEPAQGFEAGPPEPDVTEVSVSGPADKIALVTQAVVTIDVESGADTIDEAVHLQPRDDNGNLVEKITLEPAIVSVTVTIEQTTFSRPVVISPQITGLPAEGYNIIGISSNPTTVTIRGDQASIGGVTSIGTEAVDVSGEDSNVVKTVSLQLPAGTSVLGSPNVTVTVRISPAQGSVRFGVPLSVRGLGSGISVQGELPTVQVTLRGPLPELLGLSASDITAFIDLTGKEAGSHSVSVGVDAPADLEATAEPGQLEVVLEEN